MAQRPFPHHIAIIPDGNRRWARARGLPPTAGHEHGFLEVAPTIVDAAFSRGVHTLTLWLFSTENWKRTSDEIDALMDIYVEMCARLTPTCRTRGAALHLMGRTDRIPAQLDAALSHLRHAGPPAPTHVLNLAFDYGGGDEMVRAFHRLRTLGLDDFDESILDTVMDTAGLQWPNPDLIIRTSGEVRISGFMPWQSRYSELYFVEPGFPAFTREALDNAIAWFRTRERRWGK
jgi:undecaprenyl diphosphate synthase